jgi:hypothetical protein
LPDVKKNFIEGLRFWRYTPPCKELSQWNPLVLSMNANSNTK